MEKPDIRIKIHGGFQIELKCHFPVSRERLKYKLHLVLAIPQSLGVDSEHYDEKRMFSQLTVRTRFASPRIDLENLLDNRSHESPLNRLLPMLGKKYNEQSAKAVLFLLKTFANALVFHVKNYHRTNAGITSMRLLFTLADKCRAVFSDLYIGATEPEYKRWVRLSEESVFLSITSLLPKYSDIQMKKKEYSELFSALEKWGSVFGSIEGNVSGNEKALIKAAELKKWMQNSLYMNTRELPLYRRVVQAAGFAASILAMAATIALTFLVQYFFKDYSLFWIMMLVMVYALKDKMKESIKNISVKKLPLLFPAWNYTLIDPAGGNAVGFGSCRMYFRSLEKMTADELDALAKADPVDLENKRQSYLILDREVSIDGVGLMSKHENLEALAEVLRLNAVEWTSRADRPLENVIVRKGKKFIREKKHRFYAIPFYAKLEQATKTEVELSGALYLSQKGLFRA